ncbi:hypothetical protein N7493_002718 [Penicillium malachiteum]|uniref:Autophagy-related protein 2 n=1 Tax=Penicillium malachiteum TaxID=1324776 RepID=A0AAD6MZ14_9EURO|nr:hypothetical protein N7493_002718 [Penicillium malachiteum]
MAYFLPSFFQKRLLKYAISRLGLVDTEALDLDNLGICWGQRSTVELRDIGLKLEKLATLVNLPTTWNLLSARIKLLRITIPADIYSSGIICEVNGIHVHLRCLSDEPSSASHGKSKQKSQPSLGIHGSGEGKILPTPSNLAESFLEAEPEEEKEELQAAITSQSHVLHQSSSSAEDDEDEELGLGSDTLSLPSFVAGFLKGVADRLQVRIKDLSIRLEMELKQDAPSKRQPEDRPDAVSFTLGVGEIDVYDVSGFMAPVNDSLPLREGKRPVSFVDINFGLVADPSVFANYSRFMAPVSPTATMESKESQASSRAPSPPLLDSPGSESALAMTRSTIFGPPPPLLSGEYSADNEVETSVVLSNDGRFSDAESETGNPYDHYLEDSQVFGNDSQLRDGPGYSQSMIDTQSNISDLDEYERQYSERYRMDEIDRGSYSRSHSYRDSEDQPDRELFEYEHSSVHSEIPGGTPIHGSHHQTRFESTAEGATGPLDSSYRHESPAMSRLGDSRNLSQPIAPPSDSGSVGSESAVPSVDLIESKYFSHDEAQSLYMSAMSHGQGQSFMPNMPGAWDSFGSDQQQSYHPSVDRSQSEDGDGPRSGQDMQDETMVSTPKLTGPTDSYFSDQRRADDQTRSQSELRDKSLTASSPELSKMTETKKSIFSIDKILIWLPSAVEDESVERSSHLSSAGTDTDSNDLAYGVEESMFASKAFSSTRFHKLSVDSRAFFDTDSSGHHHNASIDNRLKLEVEVFSAVAHFDIATGWLLIKAAQLILSQVANVPENDQSHEPSAPDAAPQQPPLTVAIHKVSLKFVEHVPGHPCSPEYPDSLPLSHPLPSEDTVLQIRVTELNMNSWPDGKRARLSLTVSKFNFGFASEDLISFNESLKMRESTRDITTSSQSDISLSLAKSTESIRVQINTLPIHINLNIQRLEEVLGWMGGLSTILELGSSISSASTTKGGNKVPNKRPRGVHFETPAPEKDNRSTSAIPVKVDMRLGGIFLDVTGETHYLTLSTTAVKVVSRFEGIGIQIDRAILDGPFSHHDLSDSPAKVTLHNIRVEFLFAPKETDLDRLLTLITPSQDKYDDDDDIMVDTLLRQRRQGSVLRTTIGGLNTTVTSIEGLAPLSALVAELGRLSNVTKYLPEDDRPGLLTLTLVREFNVRVHVGGEVGDMNARLINVEAAWISMPSLIATQISSITLVRNEAEELVGEAMIPEKSEDTIQPQPPVLMARFIPDEMDPTFKIKLHNLRVEYTVPSIMTFLGLGRDTTGTDFTSEMASSIANLAEQSIRATDMTCQSPTTSNTSKSPPKPLNLALVFRDCVIGLNPRGSPAKGLLVLSNARFGGTMHSQESSEATLDIRKASVMIIDDVANVGQTDNLHQRRSAVVHSDQASAYIGEGYVPVTTISSATAVVKVMQLTTDGTKSLDVEFRDDLLILETCADSTQTLVAILNGLQPPTPPSVVAKYRTEVMPITDMIASLTGDAFSADGAIPAQSNSGIDIDEEYLLDDQLKSEADYVIDFSPGAQTGSGTDEEPELLGVYDSDELLDSFHSQHQVSSSMSELEFREDHFAKQSAVGGTAHRWDSTQNTYGLSNDVKLQQSPLRLRVRDMHIIWNLFDGYDWQRTRDTISKAVRDVEAKATERRARATRLSPEVEEEEESVIGDFLFNSIYIGIPANKDPRELHREINRDINDLASETGSYATTTTVTGATARQGGRPEREKKLRLHRSKHHKMTFELKGVCADLVVFPPGSGETQSSLDVRIGDLEIFDHVPTSTWKKFATYMHEAGERESGTSMVHLEILTVKPVAELAASEIVLKATILPLRLIVDQDALEFMSRFFEFRDESAEDAGTPGDVPFLQRVEVNSIKVKLDFKPKRVDYAGLRSGRTTEFMNFFILEESDMILRHAIIYGVSGFDRLGVTLNDIWMPDVKRNQLPGVLAGVAPLRSLVNVGGGVRDLVVVPMREYRKDGRIVRSIQKGALAFAKTTSNELVKLGAKLAIGTQTVLQGAEDLLTSPSAPGPAADDERDDEEEVKKISLYADQPIGVVQGLRGAFRGLERDLLLARDAVVAVPGEVVESGSAKAAAKAVLKRAPTVILRPAIGISKAVGQTLLGAGNTLDPSNRRRMEDKYKRH